MTAAETTALHTRMMKCALEVQEARAYWAQVDAGEDPKAEEAFERFWFGSRSLPRVRVLLANLRARFSAFPDAQWVLHRWSDMEPEVRRLITHWHVQLSDPLYRRFTADYLVERRAHPTRSVSRDPVQRWVEGQGPTRWTTGTHRQFASKLLSTAYMAGFVGGRRDPRSVTLPRVDLHALEYLMYLLRGTAIEGRLVDNPYLRALELDAGALRDRLRKSPAVQLRMAGGIEDVEWTYPNLRAWAVGRLGVAPGSEEMN